MIGVFMDQFSLADTPTAEIGLGSIVADAQEAGGVAEPPGIRVSNADAGADDGSLRAGILRRASGAGVCRSGEGKVVSAIHDDGEPGVTGIRCRSP